MGAASALTSLGIFRGSAGTSNIVGMTSVALLIYVTAMMILSRNYEGRRNSADRLATTFEDRFVKRAMG